MEAKITYTEQQKPKLICKSIVLFAFVSSCAS